MRVTGPILVVAGLNFVRAAKKKPQSFWTEAFSLVAQVGLHWNRICDEILQWRRLTDQIPLFVTTPAQY